MLNEMDYCLSCGEYVPEGRQICHACAIRYGLEDITGNTRITSISIDKKNSRTVKIFETGNAQYTQLNEDKKAQ